MLTTMPSARPATAPIAIDAPTLMAARAAGESVARSFL